MTFGPWLISNIGAPAFSGDSSLLEGGGSGSDQWLGESEGSLAWLDVGVV